MTEHFVGGGDGWDAIMQMAKEIHDCLTVANYNAYFMWWFVSTNDPGPLDNAAGQVSNRGYIIGQFSKFIRPGYQRVDATNGPSSNVYLSAYKGSGKVNRTSK
jgi:glucuronoarabinoxylan endo-1,4-beta-xylanase